VTIRVLQRGLDVIPEPVRHAGHGGHDPAEPGHRGDGQQHAGDLVLGRARHRRPGGAPLRADRRLGLLAEAHLLAGHLGQARSLFAETSMVAAAAGNHESVISSESQLASLAADRGDWQEAADRLERALAVIDEQHMHDYIYAIPAFTAAARLALHRNDPSEARRQLTRAMRARPAATYALPYHAVRLRLQLAKAYLALAEVATARQLLREIDDILTRRPALGTLIEEVDEFRPVLASSAESAVGRWPLTPAELRLLPYLQTHLTASGIAERLFVSSHTVKAEVKSIYRKLGVSSRNDAMQKATALGLLGA